MASKKVIVVTGSYKGIGFEIVRLLSECYGDKATVFMTARDINRAHSALDSLKAKGLSNVELAPLDISSKDSVTKFRSLIESQHNGVIHSLINNAGMAFKMAATEPFSQQAKETVENNYFGYLTVSDQLLPLVPQGGVVVNVASMSGRLGQVSSEYQKILTDAEDIATVSDVMKKFVAAAQEGKQKQAGFSNSAYGMSKLGMIAAGRVHAKQLREKNISVVNMCPGWCKSDMAGWDRPPKTAEQGADTVIWLETMSHAEQRRRTGGFFQERQQKNW